MDLGNKLLNLRKKEGLSQEEAADKLGVSRQTISKWETNQSQPDFDKILPLCKMYNITPDELLNEDYKKTSPIEDTSNEEEIDIKINTQKRAKFISLGVFTFFIAIAWFMLMPAYNINPMLSLAVFLIICGIGTYMIVYANIVYKSSLTPVRRRKSKMLRRTISIITLIMTCLYFWISFTTYAWHITWILWIVNAILIEIAKLIFAMKGDYDEE